MWKVITQVFISNAIVKLKTTKTVFLIKFKCAFAHQTSTNKAMVLKECQVRFISFSTALCYTSVSVAIPTATVKQPLAATG
jgi:hypothetical protein